MRDAELQTLRLENEGLWAEVKRLDSWKGAFAKEYQGNYEVHEFEDGIDVEARPVKSFARPFNKESE